MVFFNQAHPDQRAEGTEGRFVVPSASPPPALEVEDVSVHFRGVRALDSASLCVDMGQRHALIGPNGAGKSTLFNVIEGRVQPTSGTVRLFGKDLDNTVTHQRVRLGLSRTFQTTHLFSELSVLTNVQLAVAGRRVVVRRMFWRRLGEVPAVAHLARRSLQDWGLWTLRDRLVSELSYGQQRVLEIVVALSTGASLLLLDEPTAGISRVEAQYLVDTVQNLPSNLSVLFVEHDMEVAFAIADIVTVLADGKVIAEGPPAAIRSDPTVIEAYLGGH